MISAAVGRGGETMISAQTIEAFWNAVKHVKPLSVGPQLLARPGPDVSVPVRARGEVHAAVSCYPNAGLPNPLSPTGFDLEPPDMARYLGEFAEAGLLNIAGGCCGNTPEHIAAIAQRARGRPAARSARAGSTPTPRRRRAPPLSERPAEAPASPAAPVGLAAVHAAAGRLHDDRRAHQRRGLAEVREAHQGGQVRGGGQRRPPAGRERRQRHRHLHGRGHDRRRRGDVALPALLGQRARGRQGAVHGGLLEVGGHRGRAQVPAGQGHRQLDLAQGRRGQVPRARAHGPASTAPPSW